MKTKIFTTLFLTWLSASIAFPQGINKPKLDSLFNVLSEKNKAMGSVTIFNKGVVLYTKAIGYSLISGEEKKNSTPVTKYRIGSITKMFTAVMIFQLIEEGKITLTTTLDTYFPGIPNAKQITIGNLLNHRSGLHNFTDDQSYGTWMTHPKTQDEMLAIISKSPVDFQPNEKAAYSNSNYVVLGYIIEKASKQPYSKNLNERIASKIGLSNTIYGGKINSKNNDSFSYQFADTWKEMPETDMTIPGGAGAIVSTPTDLTKFIEALFSFKLISKISLSQMRSMLEGYGMGMFEIPFYNKKGYGHNGGIDGFASTLVYFPEDSLAVSYCTNGHVYAINSILIGILSIYYNKDYSIPTFNTIALNAEDLDKYLGIYSSMQIPLKITVTKSGTSLTAQATGQSSFTLEATERDSFKFDQAGIVMEFNPTKKEMTLKQGGGNYLFTKE